MKRQIHPGARPPDLAPDVATRTACRDCRGALNFDREYQTWPNRASMARSVRMQQRGEPSRYHWRPVVALQTTEGY
jgi:hypothetical protein